jgi:hypothetical protein
MVRRYLLRWFAVLLLLVACSFPLAPSTFAKGGGGFRGGGRSFSGGRPGGFSRSRSFSTPAAPPSPSRGTFKPAGGFTTHYDTGAAAAQRAQSSRSLYEHANGISREGRTDNTAERVGPVTRETIETRPSRQETVFNRYTRQPVNVVYHDSFNPFFWMWLMDRSQRDRDLWVYNHRDEMDQSRYQDLTRKDADLEHRLHDLEQQGVERDPSYTPPGVDKDLMYDDNHVQQAYTENHSHPDWGLLFIALAGIAVAYLVFFVPMFRPRRHVY